MAQILPSPDPNSGSKQQTKDEVQVDFSNMIGRIKPKPVCLDVTLKKQSTSYEEISKLVFVADGYNTALNKVSFVAGSNDASVVSSSSSTSSRENVILDTAADGSRSNLSDCDSKEAITLKETISSSAFSEGGYLRRKAESEQINLKVKTQTTSRNGRQTQRWYTDPATNTLYRMTTGCIPVLKDGKILFCSASRKSEWILPKGGWEKDEVMEESAIRETFEEAGVFGIIGPTLDEIAYETRKGKKRRIEFEEVQRKANEIRRGHSSSPRPVPRTEGTSSPDTLQFSKNRVDSTFREVKNETDKATSSIHSDEQSKITQQSCDGDNISVASETSLSHTHVKMSLFPLYVTEVKESWPEQGRFRKVVGIDEAIRITKSRPYFQQALIELKERNLHITTDLQPLHENETKT